MRSMCPVQCVYYTQLCKSNNTNEYLGENGCKIDNITNTPLLYKYTHLHKDHVYYIKREDGCCSILCFIRLNKNTRVVGNIT